MYYKCKFPSLDTLAHMHPTVLHVVMQQGGQDCFKAVSKTKEGKKKREVGLGTNSLLHNYYKE